MKATSKEYSVELQRVDFDVMSDYNDTHNTYKCVLYLQEVVESDESNELAAFFAETANTRKMHVILDLTNEKFGKDEREKATYVEKTLKGKVFTATNVVVDLENTYRDTESDISFNTLNETYIGSGDFEAQTVAHCGNRIAKMLANGRWEKVTDGNTNQPTPTTPATRRIR